MLKLTSCELVRASPPPFPFFSPLPPRLPFFVATSGEATDRHSVFSPKARNRRCNSCWLGGLPGARQSWAAPRCTVLALKRAQGGERTQLLPPTTPRVRGAPRWGWPGGSSSLRVLCVVLESICLEDCGRASFFAVPLPLACSGSHLCLRLWPDPLRGQGSQPWMCRPHGLPDLHGDLITRSHSWSLPKRFSAFRP